LGGGVNDYQEDVLDLLHIRLGQVVPKVVEQVTAVTDITILRQLHRTAATADTLDVFTAKLKELTTTE